MHPTRPKVFCTCAQDATCCIVEIFKKYVQLRPKDFCNDDSPMYLQGKSDDFIKSRKPSTWFKRESMGINSLGKFLPKACDLAGIPSQCNHRVRVTCVQHLHEARMPDDKIIQVTRHKSVRTLVIYITDKLRSDEHNQMQNILQQ